MNSNKKFHLKLVFFIINAKYQMSRRKWIFLEHALLHYRVYKQPACEDSVLITLSYARSASLKKLFSEIYLNF